jgi:hypothetical protein
MLTRRRLYELLEKGDDSDVYSLWIDRFFTLLVLFNIAAVIAESVPTLYQQYGSWFHQFEVFSVVVFTAEYALRLWTVAERAELSPGLNGNDMRSAFMALSIFLRFCHSTYNSYSRALTSVCCVSCD